MDKIEAIATLKANYPDACYEQLREAVDMAIAVLEQTLPPANDDLIQKIEEGIKATRAADDYSIGMRNGMKWCKSLLDGKEPEYDIVPQKHKKRWR